MNRGFSRHIALARIGRAALLVAGTSLFSSCNGDAPTASKIDDVLDATTSGKFSLTVWGANGETWTFGQPGKLAQMAQPGVRLGSSHTSADAARRDFGSDRAETYQSCAFTDPDGKRHVAVATRSKHARLQGKPAERLAYFVDGSLLNTIEWEYARQGGAWAATSVGLSQFDRSGRRVLRAHIPRAAARAAIRGPLRSAPMSLAHPSTASTREASQIGASGFGALTEQEIEAACGTELRAFAFSVAAQAAASVQMILAGRACAAFLVSIASALLPTDDGAFDFPDCFDFKKAMDAWRMWSGQVVEDSKTLADCIERNNPLTRWFGEYRRPSEGGGGDGGEEWCAIWERGYYIQGEWFPTDSWVECYPVWAI